MYLTYNILNRIPSFIIPHKVFFNDQTFLLVNKIKAILNQENENKQPPRVFIYIYFRYK